MCNSPEKMTSISGYTLTGDLPGTNTFSQNGNNKESPSPKCVGCLDASQNSLQATNFSYIKQYSNQYGLKECNSEILLPLPT
jgi:cob(I)alamin adenosyltransferase